MAMNGIDIRHSSHSSPSSFPLQCERGSKARPIAASSMMAMKGNATRAPEDFRSPPGRASLTRKIDAGTRIANANAAFSNGAVKLAAVVRSARGPSRTKTLASATAAPAATARPTFRAIRR